MRRYSWMHLMFAALLGTLAGSGVAAIAGGTAESGLPRVQLAIGDRKISVELASTPEQRATGLMNRFSLRPEQGMLFVFDQPQRQPFWMKNTYVALSIAFIGPDGIVLNIEDMAPQTETLHWSNGAAQYALEMKRGWFRQYGIGPGDHVQGLPLPSAQ